MSANQERGPHESPVGFIMVILLFEEIYTQRSVFISLNEWKKKLLEPPNRDNEATSPYRQTWPLLSSPLWSIRAT